MTKLLASIAALALTASLTGCKFDAEQSAPALDPAPVIMVDTSEADWTACVEGSDYTDHALMACDDAFGEHDMRTL